MVDFKSLKGPSRTNGARPLQRCPACGTTHAGHLKGGVHRDLVWGTRRSHAHTRCGRGVPAPILATPPIAPIRAPLPVHAQMGAPLCTPFTQAGRGQKRWGSVMTTLSKVSDFVYFLPFLFSLYHYPEHSGTFYSDPPTSAMTHTLDRSSMT